MIESFQQQPLHRVQEFRFLNPNLYIHEDLEAVYNRNEIVVGWPEGAVRIFADLVRKNTVAIVGVELGDEGKGRLVDNKLQELLKIPSVKMVNVVRFQGGNNAGHTVEKRDLRIALHQVPSGIMYPETIGILDRGMLIHPEDLMTEIGYIEDAVGDMRGKLYVSEDAILGNDLLRAEEVLNRIKQGRASGGTGRGISPGYAHHVDRLGHKIHHLMEENWREVMGKEYDRYKKEFAAYGINLAEVLVPDFKEEKRIKKAAVRSIGSKEEFLDRLEAARSWLIERDMVKNTYIMHMNAYKDMQRGILFEGAQALGLHLWLGTEPDRTSSSPSVYGIMDGTAFWLPQDIEERLGVFKITYDSSVGSRQMPTEVLLPKDVSGPSDLPHYASHEEKWAAYVREKAHERGTTTGRPRDICKMDLAFLVYNARMAGIEMLAGTHLDIAREGEYIEVCTHYTDALGNYKPYQPGLRHQKGVTPHYVYLPGWDGEAVRKAKSFDDLPDNAKRFLAFIQRRTGYPIVVATTGPKREHMVEIPEYHESGTTRFFSRPSARIS